MSWISFRRVRHNLDFKLLILMLSVIILLSINWIILKFIISLISTWCRISPQCAISLFGKLHISSLFIFIFIYFLIQVAYLCLLLKLCNCWMFFHSYFLSFVASKVTGLLLIMQLYIYSCLGIFFLCQALLTFPTWSKISSNMGMLHENVETICA